MSGVHCGPAWDFNPTYNSGYEGGRKAAKERIADLERQIAAAQAVIDEVHAWIVCAGIATPDDMSQNFHRIAEITAPSNTTALQQRLAEEREKVIALYSPDDTAQDWIDKIRSMS